MSPLFYRALCAQASLCIAIVLVACSRAPQESFAGTVVHQSAPTFILTDQRDRLFRLTSQRGHVVALFFGYTHCPDICPETLARLAQAVRELTPTERSRVRVDFVTVDPSRDDPAALARYVRLFNPTFIGLTGTERQLDPVYNAYHVWHQRLPGTRATGYLVANGSTIYLIDPHGELRVLHDWNDGTQPILHDLKELLS